MSLPTDRDELRDRWKNGERFTFLFFYGHKPPNSGVNASCFSQWFARPFEIESQSYTTAEHWMMAEKARLFDDTDMLREILNAPGPKEAKAFGRRVRNFDPAKWDQHKFDIVTTGNLAKFSQHADLKNYLLATTDFVPVADPADANKEPGSELVREQPRAYRAHSNATESGGVILVEAAGRDMIWGIGLGKNNPKSQDPMTWRGRNLLGFALTIVRGRIAEKG